MKRRHFLNVVGASAAGASLTPLGCATLGGRQTAHTPRPNILWITCEDMSAQLGCYGDKQAITPNLDKFATESVRYTNAFSTCGVCSPGRSCLITGMYQMTLGSSNMRSSVVLPEGVRTYSEHLREGGYYCTNSTKTDYQFKASNEAWDESSGKAHWKNRPDGKPFFAIFNLTATHESGIARAYPERLKNPDKSPHKADDMKPPPYYPNTPEIREMWAGYYDTITAMDAQVGDRLKELDDAGLADDTIVVFYSDHGAGLPRAKRGIYDSGMHVPMMIRWPGKIKPGTVSDRLVSFVDFGPNALSLAGVKVPENMQGLPFMGDQEAPPREYVYAGYDRIDERHDLSRAVRDKQFKYILNYEPYRAFALNVDYREVKPLMTELRKLDDAGELKGPAALWMRKTKPLEELYDLKADPHEINDIAGSRKHRKTLERMRAAQEKWMLDERDLGLVVESELWDWMSSPRPDASFKRLRDIRMLGLGDSVDAKKLTAALGEKETAYRYWGAMGLAQAGDRGLKALRGALKDPEAIVRVGAADSLRRLGHADDALPALIEALTCDNGFTRLFAAEALDDMGEAARPALDALKALTKSGLPKIDDPGKSAWMGRSGAYTKKVAQHAIKTLDPTFKPAPARKKANAAPAGGGRDRRAAKKAAAEKK